MSGGVRSVARGLRFSLRSAWMPLIVFYHTITRTLLGGLLITATVAQAGETASLHARLTPDKLGTPTNLSATATFATDTGAIPSPITKVTFYTPAGASIDLRGTSVCSATKLERFGPSGCPATSRAGFGGGVGLFQLANETIHERFTADLFVAPREAGHLTFLVYARATTPASIELVLKAKEVRAHKPYGLGFTIDVPPVPTIPGASNASVESAFVTLGSANVAYYKTVHGKRTLQHLRGLVSPKTCPRGGFSFEGAFAFADGTTTSQNATIPCPKH